MITTLAYTVASSNITTDVAYYICIVSFFVAGGVAIYLLLDKIKQYNTSPTKKVRVVKPVKRTAAKKMAPKKTVVKKSAAKKPVKRVTKKK